MSEGDQPSRFACNFQGQNQENQDRSVTLLGALPPFVVRLCCTLTWGVVSSGHPRPVSGPLFSTAGLRHTCCLYSSLETLPAGQRA